MSRSEGGRRIDPVGRPVGGRSALVRGYELFVTVPVVGLLIAEAVRAPGQFTKDGRLIHVFVWVAAIAVANLIPVPMATSFDLRLSFPLQVSVALLYPPPVACLIVLLGSFDIREISRELPSLSGVFLRSLAALAVLAESRLLHRFASV